MWLFAQLLFYLLFTGLIFFLLGWLFRGRRAASTLERSRSELIDEQQRLREANLRVKELTGKKDELSAKVNRLKSGKGGSDTEALEKQLKDSLEAREKLEKQLEAAPSGDTTDHAKELIKLTAERDQLAENLKAAQASGGDAEAASKELVKLKAERDQLAENLKAAQATRGDTEAASKELIKLTAERDQLAENLKAAQVTRGDAEAASKELIKLKAERDQLAENLKAAQATRGDAEAASKELIKLKAERDQLAENLKAAQATSGEAEAASKELIKLKAERDQLAENLKAAQSEAEAAAGKEAEIASLQAKVTELEERGADAEDQVQLKRALDRAREKIAELEADLESGQGQLNFGTAAVGAAGAAALTDDESTAELAKERDSLRTQLDTLKATLEESAQYASGARQADDLTEISGVGPGLSTKLNSFGIYTYRQIADWEAASIDAFDALLSFPGRINRDEWQKQARQLHVEKYGPS